MTACPQFTHLFGADHVPVEAPIPVRAPLCAAVEEVWDEAGVAWQVQQM